MPADEPLMPELAEVSARYAPFMIRVSHQRGTSDGWMSSRCAYRLDGCREADCCCTCHEPQHSPKHGPEPRTEGEAHDGR